VVEGAGSPSGDGMARSALGGGSGESRSDVIRNVSADGGGALERGSVAAVAVRGVQGVVVIGVAGSAGGCEVRAHQRKAGNAVIERGRIPTCGGVAVGAIGGGEGCTGGGMHRIVGSLPGGQVALRISAAVERDL
jgi:hypothetical protein